VIKQLVAAAAATLTLHGAAHAADTIKVGVLTVDAGPFASIAPHYIEAAKVFVEQVNARGGALGRKYELVMQSHAGTPASAVAAANRLAQQEGVSFLTGFNSSSMALALEPKLAALNALLIDVSSAGEDQTGKNCQANYFRASSTDAMRMNVLRSVVGKSGAKTWNMIVADYAYGHDFAKRFTALVQEQGSVVQTTLFAPQGTADFGSYITQLAAKPADGLAVVVVGSDGNAFAKQQQHFGLFGKFKTVVSSDFTNEVVLPAQGDTTVGVYVAQGYASAMPGEKNAAFVKTWEARFKRPPNYLEADIYQGLELLHAAIVKAKSTDVSAVRAALAGLKTDTIFGDVEMRAADHQLLRPVMLMQIERVSDGQAKVVLRAVEPATTVTPPPSAECKL
jgi:branched-chain amino acid transport system substrate-binding protein